MEKFLEGLEKLDNGLYRIRETIDVDYSNLTKVPIKEEKILVEGRETTPSKVGYRFKVWDSDPSEKGFNYNGRNYSKVVPLAVEQDLSTVCLMNHPDDDGDVRNICGVARNPKVDDDGWMSCLFVPCGEYGKLVSDVIEAGGPISVSSSILGELDENNYVKEKGLVVERFLDIVFGPSNGLNHYKNKVEFQNDDGSRDTIAEEDIKEMTETNENEKLTISNSEKSIKEKGENKVADKLVETSMKMNINALVKDAEKMENLYEKKNSLSDALNYANELTDKTLAEEIQTKVNAVEDELKVLSEKGLKTDELTDSVKELTETKEDLEKEIRMLKAEKAKLNSQYHTITEMYEEKQYKASEDELNKNRQLTKEVCTLKLESKNLRMESKDKDAQIQKLLRENRMLKHKVEESKAFANTQVSAEDYEKLTQKITMLESKNSYLKESLAKANSKVALAESKAKSNQSRFDVVRRKMMENRKPMAIPTSSRVMRESSNRVHPIQRKPLVENTSIEDDEDIKMEEMLK